MARFDLVRNVIEQRPHLIGKRLVLHVGTPKTGTTSLQYFLSEQHEYLKEFKIIYPSTWNKAPFDPKHQWLFHFLHTDLDEVRLAEYFAKSFDECNPHTNVTILSTEAIFTNWFKFKGLFKELLDLLIKYLQVEFLVWLREPVDFFRSYYIQCLKNPRRGEVFGRDLSPKDVLQIEEMRHLLDYESFLADLDDAIGNKNVYVFEYYGNTIAKFIELFDLKLFDLAVRKISDQKNKSMESITSIKIMRNINQINLGEYEKRQVVNMINELDEIIGPHSERFELDGDIAQEISKICPMTREQIAALDKGSTQRWNLARLKPRL